MSRQQFGDLQLDLKIDDLRKAVDGNIDAAMFAAGLVVRQSAQDRARSISEHVAERMYAISRGHEEGPPHKVARRKVEAEGGVVVSSSSQKTHLFELGVDPHTIGEPGQVLRMEDGSFVRGPIQHPGMAAQPFLRPALDESQDAALRAAVKKLRKALGS